jgi:hypothetical protein
MGWFKSLTDWLKGAGDELNEVTDKVNVQIQKGVKAADPTLEKIKAEIKAAQAKVDEAGRKVGGVKGPTNGGADLK